MRFSTFELRFAPAIALATLLPLLAGACSDTPGPLSVVEDVEPVEARAPHYLDIDTLGLTINNVWIKISALPFPIVDEVTMRWEVNATTNNPHWNPGTFHRRGARFFTEGDSAQVWGNIPRAYDFTIEVQIEAWGRVFDVQTLEVQAPKCPEGPAGLLCNW